MPNLTNLFSFVFSPLAKLYDCVWCKWFVSHDYCSVTKWDDPCFAAGLSLVLSACFLVPHKMCHSHHHVGRVTTESWPLRHYMDGLHLPTAFIYPTFLGPLGIGSLCRKLKNGNLCYFCAWRSSKINEAAGVQYNCGNQTCLAEKSQQMDSSIENHRKISMFHCHVWLPEG